MIQIWPYQNYPMFALDCLGWLQFRELEVTVLMHQKNSRSAFGATFQQLEPIYLSGMLSVTTRRR